MSDTPQEIRDSKGNLVAYNSKDIIGIEVMIANFSGRLERIESNQGDMKLIQNEMRKETKDIMEKVTTFCHSFHELVMDVNATSKLSHDTHAEAIEAKTIAVNTQTRIDTFFKSFNVFLKAGGAISVFVGAAWGFIKLFGKNLGGTP